MFHKSIIFAKTKLVENWNEKINSVQEYEYIYVQANSIEFTNISTNIIDVLDYAARNHEEGVHPIMLL